jgi:hypothetical protein
MFAMCVVQVLSTPLMRIESGSLICLDEKCFTPPAPPSLTMNEALEDMNRARKIMKAKTAVAVAAADGLAPPPPLSSDHSATPRGPAAANSAQPAEEFPYHLELTFASSCVYLRLPLSDLKQALKEQDYKTTFGIIFHAAAKDFSLFIKF